MPTYIAMLKWTSQGVENLKQSSPARLDAARKSFEAVGIKMKDFYMTMGQHDIVTILEAPDDTTLARAMLGLLAKGATTTETCRAFTEDEYRKILAGLP